MSTLRRDFKCTEKRLYFLPAIRYNVHRTFQYSQNREAAWGDAAIILI